ncbi:HEPN domain-containing protein [[Brevibacterium] frigoritolerans]|nr:HEPN domain-containing protein [Peribacillus frigoritolerans]
MKYRFITILHNMKLETIKNKGTEIFPGARISNGPQVLSKTLDTELMRDTLGVLSKDEFDNMVYLYVDGELANIPTKQQMDEIGTDYTFFLLRKAQSFIEHLWQIKDNNIYVRDGFLLTYNKQFEDGCTYKASLSEIYSYATCEEKESNFSNKEISSAILAFSPYALDGYKEKTFGGKNPNSDHFYKNKGSQRMVRAEYFTLGARGSAIVPMKIVSYCNALECLFTTGKTEVNHKIAERVAIMLGTSKESKLHLFDLVKKAYTYRSSLVHGQYLKGTEENLLTISKELDDILRKLLVGKHEIFSKSDAEMNDFFDQLLFN